LTGTRTPDMIAYSRIPLIFFFLCTAFVRIIIAGPPFETNSHLQEIYRFDANEYDQELVKAIAENRLTELQKKGYLLAKMDSIVSSDDSHELFIFKGNVFNYELNQGNISETVIERLKIKSFFSPENISFSDFENLAHKLLRYYGDIGYPFARINKTSIIISDHLVIAALELETQEYITFSAIGIPNEINLSEVFLGNHLGIREGLPYNETLAINLERKLGELSFVRLNEPVGVGFSQQQATIFLPLVRVPANRFDGILGVVSSDDPQAVLQLTGSMNLYLINSLGHGEFFDMSWQGPGKGTQILNIKAGYPYPLGLPLKPGGQFTLHRQDTTWLKILQKPVLSFIPSISFTISIFAHLEQNNILATRQYKFENALPRNLDYRLRLYGIELEHKSDRFFTDLLLSGNHALISLSAGQQTIVRNSSLPGSIYEDLEMKSTRFEIDLMMEKRWKLSQQSTLSLSTQSNLSSGKDFFENQMKRLGGFSSLKGFDELSLLASSYIFGDAEIRFFTSEKTYFSGFINGGWYERKQKDDYYRDFPLGIGTGLNLETQAGIFSIYVALGMKKDDPPQLRNSKIHIGYASVF
jgi:outer membrane protein assembly factor BamA